ncbi:hypothetical protein HX858_09030 [Marine Group I thaumarchaeote]|uniref:Uncharacterized protein n=1 Tax=Marine Group I thaumarchaeote TaxID=2511932 RepID=A0A7K4MWI5_9ARCH|nr:hypothetical protein [Marine Group I thaumarchaeote]
MTANEMIAALVAVKEEIEMEDFVKETVEDMSEEDLYCNFLSGEETERYSLTEEGDLTEE